MSEPAGETILLVEDEESVRFVLSKSLSLKGYHVIEALNGNEALEVLDGGETIDGRLHGVGQNRIVLDTRLGRLTLIPSPLVPEQGNRGRAAGVSPSCPVRISRWEDPRPKTLR